MPTALEIRTSRLAFSTLPPREMGGHEMRRARINDGINQAIHETSVAPDPSITRLAGEVLNDAVTSWRAKIFSGKDA